MTKFEEALNKWGASCTLYAGGDKEMTIAIVAERKAAVLAAHAAAVAEERERCAAIAYDHECGGDDDVVCQHMNCGMAIAGAIREGGKQ